MFTLTICALRLDERKFELVLSNDLDDCFQGPLAALRKKAKLRADYELATADVYPQSSQGNTLQSQQAIWTVDVAMKPSERRFGAVAALPVA